MIEAKTTWRGVCLAVLLCATSGTAAGQSGDAAGKAAAGPPFAELKTEGALRSRYRTREPQRAAAAAPEPDLATFRADIEPILSRACSRCHGPEKQKGDVRIDTLDPDLFAGSDVDWWLDVLAVLTNGEMPPADDDDLGEATFADDALADDDRRRVIEWLATESQIASSVRRATTEHSSFRRMARYEYDYALQDLLGLPYDFAADLPPDPVSVDGFENSSEVLHLTGVQFRTYLESAQKALRAAMVVGDRPEPIYWGVSMTAAAAVEWAKQDKQLADLRHKHEGDADKLAEELKRRLARFASRPKGAHYHNRDSARMARQSWGYGGAQYAWSPSPSRPEPPAAAHDVAVIPPGAGLIVELGDQIPETGTLRVRVRAARASSEGEALPSMQLEFGWQASNDSRAASRISERDIVVDAAPGALRFYQWHVPLSQIYPRNSVRTISKMGDLPSPSEFLRFVNSSLSGGDIHIDYVEVTAPFYEQWPPASHTRIFVDSENVADEGVYAREVLTSFASRAWRRQATTAEIEQKMRLFERLRPQCDSFQDAMVETLATVLASPNFLYVVAAGSPSDGSPADGSPADGAQPEADSRLSDPELATRLSMFLWCSTPDEQLRAVAAAGRLRDAEVLGRQVARMLADPKSRRLSQQFVRQWLGLQLLEFLHVDGKAYPEFDAALKEAMREEPVAFFQEVLQDDLSALEFLHSDFTMANERLAQHYGVGGVTGNHFRRVELEPGQRRGGLLTQAGLLAMNSDGVHSHPLKRGIWLLERLLDDPPPPPPAAVPVIDLTDPEIAKMTLKQRIENHRNDPACMSCHQKIDPWGVAFENFDAVGSWRTEVQGAPVDAIGVLFNKQRLDGMDGLKRFLLLNRQDQFLRALVHKLTTFALGRPLGFADRAAIDEITAETRRCGDGLATMVTTIATSKLFQSK